MNLKNKKIKIKQGIVIKALYPVIRISEEILKESNERQKTF